MSSKDVGYDPHTYKHLTFHDATPAFLDGSDTPRAYLERCLQTIDEREPVVKAWASLRVDGARADADAATARYRQGRPLSSIDGMPIGVKDLIATKDLPTNMGIIGYENFTRTDSASIQAIRKAGGIILGKTTTTEMGMADPAPTTNPFDRMRTPGGSSSGSGAAIGARMVPAALGSQVVGSLIRPASYNANFAHRPTVGGLNRGERLGYSHAIIGVHAGSLADMWQLTIEISKRVGGDPGYPGIFGSDEVSAPIKPKTLIMIETEGWSQADDATIEAFENVLAQLRHAGVTVLRRKDHKLIELFEQGIAESLKMAGAIVAWENRWNLENLVANHGDKLRGGVIRALERGRGMVLEDYRTILVQRDEARARLAALDRIGDALITLSSPGPAPHLEPPAVPDNRVPYGTTGPTTFNVATSVLGAPAVTVPLLAIETMPVGIQVIGQRNADEKITGIARWLYENATPVVG